MLETERSKKGDASLFTEERKERILLILVSLCDLFSFILTLTKQSLGKSYGQSLGVS